MIAHLKENKFFRPFIWTLKRAVLLYAAGFLVFYGMVNFQDVTDKARVAALNRLMPNIDGLADFIATEKPLKRAYLEDWAMYYRAFEGIAGGRADTYGMLGFCSYYLGKIDKAIEYFEEAVIYNPHFFWFYYDLAVIYFEQGKYEKAIGYLQAAVDANPEATKAFLNITKPYLDLLTPFENKGEIVGGHYRRGRVQAFKMLILSHFYLKDYAQVAGLSLIALETLGEEKDFFNFYAGLAALELKEYPLALRYFQECIKSGKNYADAFYYFSVLNKLMGNDSLADQMMVTALGLRDAGAPERPELGTVKVSIF